MGKFDMLAALCLLSSPVTQASATQDDLIGSFEPSAKIVGGFTDAFLRNSQVSVEERRCLSNGASSFASSLTSACNQALQTYKRFAAPALPPAYNMTMPSQIAPAAQSVPVAGLAVQTATVTEGEQAVVAMELAASLSHVYKMQTKVAKSCLKGDVLDEFDRAERHLSNVTYVGGRLLTEGVDIMDELDDAFNSYEHQNYRAFGNDLGTAGRKVLLSKHSGLADFKEPSAEAIEEVTEGLFASFLGRGYDLQIVTDDAPASPATAPATLNIDVHTCVSENMAYWKSAWAPMWDLASAAASGSVSEAPDTSEMMVSMMDLQTAMARCKITPEMEALLIDSMEASKLHASLKLPGDKFKEGSVPSLLASALEDFRDRKWYGFGNQLGAAMQDLAVVTFSQKFEVDADQVQLDSRQSPGAVVIGAVSVGFLVMLTVVGVRRAIFAARASSGCEVNCFDRAPELLDDDLEAFVE